MSVSIGCVLMETVWGPCASPEALRSTAQLAESLGYDSVWIPDHIVIPGRVDAAYPYDADGISPFDPNQPYYETLSVLNFLAGCTQRVRLGTYVLIIPYRHPVLTAKILATIDVLSGGRVILGAGAGWMEEEFQALGLDTFARRGAVTNEYLRLFKELWTSDKPDFQGEYYQVSDLGFLPKPVQKPHPPIWIGGHTEPALRRAARLGDGWLPLALREPAKLEPEELSVKIKHLRDLTRRAGRPEDAVDICLGLPIAFGKTAGSSRELMNGQPEEIANDMRQYCELGIRNFVLGFRADSVAGKQETMEEFAREVMPLVAEKCASPPSALRKHV